MKVAKPPCLRAISCAIKRKNTKRSAIERRIEIAQIDLELTDTVFVVEL